MSEQNHFYYPLLELNRNASEKEIKRAYAQRLKSIDQAANPAAFTALRAEYERALHFAKNPQQESDFDWLNDEEIETPSEPENQNKQKEPVQTVSLSELSLSIQLFFSNFIELLKQKNFSVKNVTDHINQYLQGETFVHLEAKMFFERDLIEHLAQGNFGDSSLKVLIAAKTYFNWNESYKFAHTNSAIERVLFLLDELDSIDQDSINSINFLLKKPNPTDSTTALDSYQKIASSNPAFLTYCVSERQFELWKEAKKDRSYLQILFDYLEPHLKNIPINKKLFFALILLAIFKIFILGTDSKKIQSEIEIANIQNLCDKAYSDAIENNWQGFKLKTIDELKECALIKQPVTCQDREKLLTVATIANQLDAPSNYSPGVEVEKYLIINTSGLMYELEDGANCQSINAFMTSAHWDLSVDEQALAKVAQRYLACNQLMAENIVSKKYAKPILPYDSLKASEQIVLSQSERLIYTQLSNSVFAGSKSSNRQEPLLTASQVLRFAKPYSPLTMANLQAMRYGNNNIYYDHDPLPRSKKILKQHIEAPLDSSTCITINDVTNTNRDNIINAGPLEIQSIIKSVLNK
jgi:hypothetical protein